MIDVAVQSQVVVFSFLIFLRIRNATTESGQLSLILVLLLTLNYTLIPLFLGCFAVVLPFAVFQIWCYMVCVAGWCVSSGAAFI